MKKSFVMLYLFNFIYDRQKVGNSLFLSFRKGKTPRHKHFHSPPIYKCHARACTLTLSFTIREIEIYRKRLVKRGDYGLQGA